MVDGGPLNLFASKYTLKLSGLSIRFGTNHWMLDESNRTMSGTVEEPARLVQPETGSQRRDLTMLRVEFSQAHTNRISPLCASRAEGYLASPDESRTDG